jgi:hypothetical protein
MADQDKCQDIDEIMSDLSITDEEKQTMYSLVNQINVYNYFFACTTAPKIISKQMANEWARYFNSNIVNIAYDEEFIKLISGEKVNSSYIPKSLQMKTDGRSIDQYHLNIGLSWVVEDYLVEHSHGRYAKMGCDSKRTFLQANITNEGDLKDLKTGRIIEVIQDHTGYIKKKGYANLRLFHYAVWCLYFSRVRKE